MLEETLRPIHKPLESHPRGFISFWDEFCGVPGWFGFGGGVLFF